MTCASAHGADDEPVAAGAGILIHGACKVCAFVLCAVEAEGGGVAGQREVVVDGLGHVDVVDGILLCLKELCNAVCGGSGIVSANGDKELDVVFLEEAQVEVLLKVIVGGFETAHLEVGATTVEIGVGLEEINVLCAGILGEKPAVTAMKADYTVSIGKECLGYRHDNGIHARSRAAAAEDDDRVFHF